jgi:signal transduction histidine kinase
MVDKTSVSSKATVLDIMPNLFSLSVAAGISQEGFLRLVSAVLWQIRRCSSETIWHGGYIVADKFVVFCSMLEGDMPPDQELPAELAQAFEIGAIELLCEKSFWELIITEALVPGGLAEWAGDYTQAIASAISKVLSEKANLTRQNRELMHEMFITNQGVMAMMEPSVPRNCENVRSDQDNFNNKDIESKHSLLERLRVQEQALAQSYRLASVGKLTAGVAHEINNPLAFIRVNAEFFRRTMVRLGDGATLPADLQSETVRSVEAVFRGVERIAKIVESLRYFSRGDHGEKEPIKLAECLREAWFLISSGNKNVNVNFNSEIPDDLYILGNRQQIEQVFVNLLSNSINAFIRQGMRSGKIWVTAEPGKKRPGEMLIGFCDDGGGIASEDLPRIFDPFFTTDRRYGMGLGLSIVQGIVEENGGNIVPETEDGVTTFWITLPLVSHVKGKW